MPDAGVRSDWWNPRWVPFASDGGGDSFCVDLCRPKEASPVKLIVHHHAADAQPKKATSVQVLLDELAEHLEELAGENE